MKHRPSITAGGFIRPARRQVIALLAGALAALAGAAPVRADPRAEAVCTIDGVVRTLGNGIGILSNTGFYTFDSAETAGEPNASCLTRLANGSTGIADMNMSSGGTFNNVLCGTSLFDNGGWLGTLDATATATTPAEAAELVAFWTDGLANQALKHHLLTASGAGTWVFEGTPVLGSAAAGQAVGIGPISVTDPTPQEINAVPGVCTTDLAINGTLNMVFPEEEPAP